MFLQSSHLESIDIFELFFDKNHSFVQQIFFEYFLCAKFWCRSGSYSDEAVENILRIALG